MSGVGTALNLKEHIEKQIKEYDTLIEVKPVAFLNNNLEEELNDIEAEYNIIAICGTIDIDYKTCLLFLIMRYLVKMVLIKY